MIMVVYVLSILGAILPEKMWMRILFGLGVWMIGTALVFALEAST